MKTPLRGEIVRESSCYHCGKQPTLEFTGQARFLWECWTFGCDCKGKTRFSAKEVREWWREAGWQERKMV